MRKIGLRLRSAIGYRWLSEVEAFHNLILIYIFVFFIFMPYLISYLRPTIALGLAMIMAIACLFISPVITQAETLSFSHAQLKGRNFSGRILAGSGFANANMEGTNFENADLRGTVFSASILRKANLKGADFSGGLLDQADFAKADLSQALLVEAILLRSTFDFVNIDGTDFTDAIMDGAQRKWLCTKAKGTNLKTGVDTRESLECA